MVEYNINLEGKTILVTGAAGFIGSNLVKRLFHDVQNIKVIGIDSITDYYDVNIKHERLKEIEEIASSLNREVWRVFSRDGKCHVYKLSLLHLSDNHQSGWR